MGVKAHQQLTFSKTIDLGLQQASITSTEGDKFALDNGVSAVQATSCIVLPQIGDKILYWQDNNDCYITHILSQPAASQASDRQVALPQQQGLKINAKNLVFNIAKSLSMNVVNEINLNAAVGKINLYAQNLTQHVQKSLLQMAGQLLQRCDFLDVNTKLLAKNHAKQQLITAEKDLKMDAERINMG